MPTYAFAIKAYIYLHVFDVKEGKFMTIDLPDPRAQRGLMLISSAEENIRRIDRSHYQVRSQSGNGWYDVHYRNIAWSCNCPDSLNGNQCKHGWAVDFSLRLRNAIRADTAPARAQPAASLPGCPKCASADTIKKALRQTKHGSVQRFKCKVCGFRFSPPSPVSRVRVEPKLVIATFDLWAKKVSYRQIAHHLRDVYGVTVGKSSVERWVRSMGKALAEYADKVIGESGKTGRMWHGDETSVNINGKLEWAWNIMDHESRLWLASTIAHQKGVPESRIALRKATAVAGTKPSIFVTDGNHAYNDAVRAEWYSNTNPTHHMVLLPMRRHPRLIGVPGVPSGIHPGNNICERLQGTQRERTKVMRGFDREPSAQELIDGFRAYFNMARPHMGLGGKTPAEASGIVMPDLAGMGRLEAALTLARKRGP